MRFWKQLFGNQETSHSSTSIQTVPLARHYSSKKWDFDLDYPEDWKVQWENEAAGSWTTAVCIVGPVGSGGRPGIIVNARHGVVLEGGGSTGGSGIRVITIGAGGQSANLPKTSRDYIEKSKQELARSFSGFKFISGEEIQVAGRPAARMVYTYNGDAGRIQEFCITRFGVMVTFQFTCEVPAADVAAIDPVFKKIIESFKLKS